MTVAMMQVEEQQKNHVHEEIRQLRDNLERMKSKKRKLSVQLVAEMNSERRNRAMLNAMVALLEMQIQEIVNDQARNDTKNRSLED